MLEGYHVIAYVVYQEVVAADIHMLPEMCLCLVLCQLDRIRVVHEKDLIGWSIGDTCMSLKRRRSHNECCSALCSEKYSASQVLKATTSCFLDCHDSGDLKKSEWLLM